MIEVVKNMETNVNQSPFLKLLEPENLSKINIDAELVPIFKEVILKINDYFNENDLMDSKDWDSFFEKYLLTPSDSQYQIKKVLHCYVKNACGQASTETKEIMVTSIDSKILCHEFIHFLVEANRPKKYEMKIEHYEAFNEGMTEKLARLVMGGARNPLIGGYDDEVELVDLYCSLAGKRSPFKCFLNNEFYFDYESRKWPLASSWARSFTVFPENRESHRKSLQRFITENALKDYVITSFEEYLDFVNKFNNHSYYYNNIDDYQTVIEKIIECYTTNLNLSVENEQILKEKLMSLAILSRKSQKYGFKEVSEYWIDGVLLAYDKDGKIMKNLYYQKLNVPVQIQMNKQGDLAAVTYNGMTYEMKPEYKNYQREYEECLTEIHSFIKLLTMPNSLEESDTEYEKEKQRILNARFSDKDKQRILKELEEEYMGNNIENNGVKKR